MGDLCPGVKNLKMSQGARVVWFTPSLKSMGVLYWSHVDEQLQTKVAARPCVPDSMLLSGLLPNLPQLAVSTDLGGLRMIGAEVGP